MMAQAKSASGPRGAEPHSWDNITMPSCLSKILHEYPGLSSAYNGLARHCQPYTEPVRGGWASRPLGPVHARNAVERVLAIAAINGMLKKNDSSYGIACRTSQRHVDMITGLSDRRYNSYECADVFPLGAWLYATNQYSGMTRPCPACRLVLPTSAFSKKSSQRDALRRPSSIKCFRCMVVFKMDLQEKYQSKFSGLDSGDDYQYDEYE